MGVLRPIGHDERLSIVDHLDELRTRLIWCLVVFVGAFSLCYWQNEKILDIVNKPLEESQHPGKGNDPLEQAARYDKAIGQALSRLAPALGGTQDAARRARRPARRQRRRPRPGRPRRRASWRPPRGRSRSPRETVPKDTGRRPVTLGVAEPFVVTFTVAGYAALLLSLPFILWQAYAFLLPAFDPARTPRRAPADGDGARPVRRRRALRLLRRAPARRRLPPELQRRRVRHPHPGARLLPLRRRLPRPHGPRLPGARRRPRAHPHRRRQRAHPLEEPGLRHPRDRRPRRRRHAHARPRDDARHDGAALLLYEISIVLAWIFRPRGDTITQPLGRLVGRRRTNDDDDPADDGPGGVGTDTAGAEDAPARVS